MQVSGLFYCLGFLTVYAPALAGGMPTGFNTQVLCDAAFGRVGFAQDAAILDLGGRILILEEAVSASGARYINEAEEAEFWIKGDESRLTWGEADMNCTLQTSDHPWVAHGNEPGWRISVEEGRFRAELDYGETVIEGDLPPAEVAVHGLTYDMENFGLTVRAEICHDDMSGQTYPESAVLSLGETTLRGCAGAPADLLSSPEWQIEEVAGTEVIDAIPATLAFQDMQVSGSTGCNRFTGGFELTGEGLGFGPLAVTRMMCPEAQMQQEARVLDALSNVDRFDIDETGALILYGADQPLMTARR